MVSKAISYSLLFQKNKVVGKGGGKGGKTVGLDEPNVIDKSRCNACASVVLASRQ